MPTYPLTIRRCQHIKVNGIQCGSPALHNEMRCFFHHQYRRISEIDTKSSDPGAVQLPTLQLPTIEDANSIQLGLAEVMRLLVTQIDHPTASLLLRALRIAAANVKFTTLEPKPTHIVIDPECVPNRPLGATAWSTEEGREYDVIETSDETNDGTNDPANGKNQTGNAKKGAAGKPDRHQTWERDQLPSMEELNRQHIAEVMCSWAGIVRSKDFPENHEDEPDTPAENCP
jgi:hypothetical protein